ncbi:hypothetical protein E5P75_05040 [Helicobacter pylori]|nr:hypothetical protein [Helicobacter pylori]WQX08745.1 hypothetical protein E5P75_05040 [Helicobacter pylori]
MTTMLNKYVIEFLKAKFREIIRYFSMDIEASKIAKITRISRVIINKIIKQIRILITKECEKITQLNGEIEVDEG